MGSGVERGAPADRAPQDIRTDGLSGHSWERALQRGQRLDNSPTPNPSLQGVETKYRKRSWHSIRSHRTRRTPRCGQLLDCCKTLRSSK